MLTKRLMVVIAVLLVATVGCVGVNEPIVLPTFPPLVSATATAVETDEPIATEVVQAPAIARTTPTFEPSIAGGDFLAIAVDDLGNGWMRIRTAGNRDNCAWSNQFQMQVSGLQLQVPHCWEMRGTGSGTVTFVFRPDSIGYDTSDTQHTGLAFWPAGNNGWYRVTRSGVQTDMIALTTGPEGINFSEDGGEVTITIALNNGYFQMPLGEIRNNVLPEY